MSYDSPAVLSSPEVPVLSPGDTASSLGNNIVLSVQNVGKSYRLWNSPKDRLRQPFRSLFTKWIGVSQRQYFREFWALRDVSLEVAKGETLGIIGKNGSGKSTLLQLICSTLSPTEGTIESNGRIGALLELGSGFHSDFTGRENVYMNAAISGLSEEEVDAKYAKIVEFADIGDFIDQPVKTYSSGMHVRLAFAVAIHVNADILVIDEALAVGDAPFVQKCMRFLRRFQKHGTLIFVSHDTGSVASLCDRVILLDRGRVQMDGPPRQVCDFYIESVFADLQEVKGIPESVSYVHRKAVDSVPEAPHSETDLLQKSEIQPTRFSETATEFGAGGAYITQVELLDANTGMRLSWVVGGERVIVSVQARTEVDLENPIIGFLVRDRLGQILLNDNTYLTYKDLARLYKKGTCFNARFTFLMPVLMQGDYSITVGLAIGTIREQAQLHYVCDALFFRSEADSDLIRLVGIPMESITMREIS